MSNATSSLHALPASSSFSAFVNKGLKKGRENLYSQRVPCCVFLKHNHVRSAQHWLVIPKPEVYVCSVWCSGVYPPPHPALSPHRWDCSQTSPRHLQNPETLLESLKGWESHISSLRASSDVRQGGMEGEEWWKEREQCDVEGRRTAAAGLELWRMGLFIGACDVLTHFWATRLFGSPWKHLWRSSEFQM